MEFDVVNWMNDVCDFFYFCSTHLMERKLLQWQQLVLVMFSVIVRNCVLNKTPIT